MVDEKDEEKNPESPKTKSTPGIYSREERMEKILQYKKKIMKWRVAHPLNRNYLGRSFIAGSKPRIKGKFVSKEEYQKCMEIERRNQFFNLAPKAFSMSHLFGTKMG